MKVTQYEGKSERKILIAMIVDKEVLGRISTKWTKEGLFKNKWCNIAGGWCVKHFEKYGKAPGKHIESLYEQWSETPGADKDTSLLLSRLLADISGEYAQLQEGINPEYYIDLATDHFNRVRLGRLASSIEKELESGKASEAFKKVNSFDKIEMGKGESIDVFADPEAVRRAFESKKEPLITYPGALGSFFGEALERDALVSFESPDKRGKSYWLMDLVWNAVLQRHRTAYFVIGDMTEGQVMRRLMTRAMRRPLRPTRKDHPVKYPTAIHHVSGEKEVTVDIKERPFKKEVNWHQAWHRLEDILKTKIKSQGSILRLSCHPALSLNVYGVRSQLQAWERRDWVPEVVVIDYADNLAPIDGRIETLHQINATWQALSSLRQELHCLVATATQSNAAAYKADLLTQSHFSGNKMKRAHVTATIGINQTYTEKEQDVCRLNFIVLREGEYAVTRVVYVAGCRPIANIACRSTF